MSIRKSLVFSYLDRYASLLISIVSSMVIARLLTPADIGVFSVTMVLLTFVATLRDMGAGGYLVQEKELTNDRIRAVWAVQLGLGLALGLLVFAASIPVAAFYNDLRMRDIMFVAAANYVINPFGSLTYAWQIREMRFEALAFVRFCSTLAGALISIYLAWIDMGPISLAYGALASTLVNALMAIYFRPKWFPWLPGLKEIRRVLAYGSQTTGAAMFQTLGASTAELVLGKMQSMVATGLYSRASGLVAMFDRLVMSGISSVAISWFAKQSREHGSIAQPFLKATSYVTAIGWAFSAGLIFLAHPAIRLLYGDQWDDAGDITRLLAIALALGVPAAMCNPVLMATGAVSRVLRITAITTVISVVCTVIGATYGLLPLGMWMIFARFVGTVLWLQSTHNELQFDWLDLTRTLRESALVGAASAIVPALVFLAYGSRPENIWLPLAIGIPGAMAGFIVAVILLNHPLHVELQAIKQKFAGQN